jgi:hypothetical protein
MPRYKLRTLLILLAVAIPAAWVLFGVLLPEAIRLAIDDQANGELVPGMP